MNERFERMVEQILRYKPSKKKKVQAQTAKKTKKAKQKVR